MIEKLDLLSFAADEYERRGWGEMPQLHARVFEFLENTMSDPARVLRMFRGAGKSTVVAIYNAWRLHVDPEHQILVQGADDALAHDLSRDTLAIMESNPITTGMVRQPAAVTQWWTETGFERNARTPQLRARGILSRTTGSRADEIQNDDVEVSKNVESEPARMKLRRKLAEQTHIIKPGGSKLFIGTPHHNQSIYDEVIAAGAKAFTVPLFAGTRRYENAEQTRYAIEGAIGLDGVWCFVGIGPHARLLAEGDDYVVDGGCVVLARAPGELLDVCTGNAWPERFTRRELLKRRRECRTVNEWDSQYQLIARPLGDVRLDPALLRVYDDDAKIAIDFMGTAGMWIGSTRIVSASLRLDPASGKLKRDVSALCLVLADANGGLYWHKAIALRGQIADIAADGRIAGGQVDQICDVIKAYQLSSIEVETNGIGGHVPAILRGALKARGLQCGVIEVASTVNKNRRILTAFEPPMRSRCLWIHRAVLDVVQQQMIDWNPAVADQPDDFLDAAAGAILAEPVRIDWSRVDSRLQTRAGWQPIGGTYEVAVDFSPETGKPILGQQDRGYEVDFG